MKTAYWISYTMLILALICYLINFFFIPFPARAVRTCGIVMLVSVGLAVFFQIRLRAK